MTQSFYSVAFAKEISHGPVGRRCAHHCLSATEGRRRERVPSLLPGISTDPANFSDRGTDSSWGGAFAAASSGRSHRACVSAWRATPASS